MQTEHLTPEEAVNYLSRAYGIHYSPKYFAKLRHTGDGAEHIKFSSRVYYTPEQLDEWVKARRLVRRSTSERSVSTKQRKRESTPAQLLPPVQKPGGHPGVKSTATISRDLDIFKLLAGLPG